MYSPVEDSYLLSSEIKKYLAKTKDRQDIKVLDMGSGTGVQAITCIESEIERKNILCADISREAVNFLKKNELIAVKSDLFSKIKSKKFSLIIFNPPYLPKDKYDNKSDTTAGKKGNETIIKFIKQAKSHLEKKGVILLLFSSLSKPKTILEEAKKLGYKEKKMAKLDVGFFEKLFVYQFKL